MKLLSATIATVVGAAAADPATVIAVPSQQKSNIAVQQAVPVHTVQTVQAVHPAAATQYIGQQPVYVAAQPSLVGGGVHQVMAQPLLEQQLMRSPQMATMTHLYNIPQTVATVAQTVPVVYQQQVKQVPQVVDQTVQQIVRQDNQVVPVQVPVQVVKKEGEVSQQFHSQDDFGNYAYGYTNDNSEKQEVGNTRSGQVKGHYTYVDGNGMNRRVDYVADNNGFRAKGDGIKIKREAEPEPEAEAQPEAEPEAEAVHQQQQQPKVQMASYMKAAGADQPEGMRMTSYMSSNGAPLSVHDVQQVYSNDLQSPMMTYYNRPMVYMAMHGPSRGTFTATRTVDDMVDSYNMGDRRMDNLRMSNGGERMESMRMGGDRRFDMMNMRRTNANIGRQMDKDMFYQGQYLNNNLYRNRLMRNNVFKTNPSTFMEIQQFEMQPNRNYRFDF